MNTSTTSIQRRKQNAGLTLVEILAVLIILTIAGTLVMQNMTPKIEEARYDATIDTLEKVSLAIQGDLNDPNDSVVNYLSDVGDLPDLVDPGSSPATALSALWEKPQGISSYAVRECPGDDEDIKIATGWRKYMDEPTQGLVSGWGEAAEGDGGFTCPYGGARIGSIWFPDGPQDPYITATGKIPENPDRKTYDLDVLLTSVSGMVRYVGEGEPDAVTVRVFGPDGNNGLVKVWEDEFELDASGFASFDFDDIPKGKGRAIRAIVELDDDEHYKDTTFINIPVGGLSGVMLTVNGPSSDDDE